MSDTPPLSLDNLLVERSAHSDEALSFGSMSFGDEVTDSPVPCAVALSPSGAQASMPIATHVNEGEKSFSVTVLTKRMAAMCSLSPLVTVSLPETETFGDSQVSSFKSTKNVSFLHAVDQQDAAIAARYRELIGKWSAAESELRRQLSRPAIVTTALSSIKTVLDPTINSQSHECVEAREKLALADFELQELVVRGKHQALAKAQRFKQESIAAAQFAQFLGSVQSLAATVVHDYLPDLSHVHDPSVRKSIVDAFVASEPSKPSCDSTLSIEDFPALNCKRTCSAEPLCIQDKNPWTTVVSRRRSRAQTRTIPVHHNSLVNAICCAVSEHATPPSAPVANPTSEAEDGEVSNHPAEGLLSPENQTVNPVSDTEIPNADDPEPKRPPPLVPEHQGPDETAAAFQQRLATHATHLMVYTAAYSAWSARKNAANNPVSVRTSRVDSKALSSIAELKIDSSIPVSEWLRKTRTILQLRDVGDETQQVRYAATYLSGNLARRWQVVDAQCIRDSKPLTWKIFETCLLTSVDGKQPAELARQKYDNFVYLSSDTCSKNLHAYRRVLDTMEDTMPGTRFRMPSGYDQCEHFLRKVLDKCPITVKVGIQSHFQAALRAQELDGFFTHDLDVVDRWYKNQRDLMLMQAAELANVLPAQPARDPSAPSGSGRTHGRDGLPLHGLSSRQEAHKRKPEEPKSGESKKPKSGRWQVFLAQLKAKHPTEADLLHYGSNECLFCGMTNHSANKCLVNLDRRFAGKADKIAAAKLAKDFAKKFFAKK